MSSGQIVWLFVCVCFALFWITVGWIIAPFLNVFLFFLSLFVAIPSFIRHQP